ncbi:MAG: HugZ family protein [Gammaproteobacteria bacterium]|nr:HugZ family protein [Gammaproteobacteria bacterium]
MADTPQQEARSLLLQCYDGVLSTLSVSIAGYPFGSVVPFCLDRQGAPIILIADIAQHTKNIKADSRVSLIVFDRGAPDLQANGRLTLIADASLIDIGDQDTPERYYRCFPEARGYHQTHGFLFWRLQPRRLRFIGGFGAIHWLEPEEVLPVNPFTAVEEAGMVDHMNADHVAAMRKYCASLLVDDVDSVTPQFAGCDRYGFHLLVGARVLRIAFETPVNSPIEVRQALVALARR